MFPRSLSSLPAVLLLFALAACNLPLAKPTAGPSANDQAATIVAATMKAVPSATAAAPVTPFASPAVPTVTPTAKPTFAINTDNAKCSSGPAADAKLVTKFAAGTIVDLVGKDTADSFYIVVDPASHDLCWIEAQFGAPAGSFSLIPELTPQATTQSASVPARPTALFYSFQCLGGGQVTVDLKWADVAGNETGYRVYRNGNQIADLPANSTNYSDSTTIASGTVLVYQVAAYNDAGTSPQAVTGNGDPITCQ